MKLKFSILIFLSLILSCRPYKMTKPLCTNKFESKPLFLVYSINYNYFDSIAESKYFLINDTNLLKSHCSDFKAGIQGDGEVQYIIDFIENNHPTYFYFFNDTSKFDLGLLKNHLIPVTQERYVISDIKKVQKIIDSVSQKNKYYCHYPFDIKQYKYHYDLKIGFVKDIYLNDMTKYQRKEFKRNYNRKVQEELYIRFPEIPINKLRLQPKGNHYIATFPCDSNTVLDISKLRGSNTIFEVENIGRRTEPFTICIYNQ